MIVPVPKVNELLHIEHHKNTSNRPGVGVILLIEISTASEMITAVIMVL